MSIDTEKLCAFLDNELSTAEAEQVRRQLEHDEESAAQLAAMIMTDERIRQHVDHLAQTPIPNAITQMLSDNNVKHGPWQQRMRAVQRHTALAASITLIFGLSIGAWLTNTHLEEADQTFANAVKHTLETRKSGASYQLTDTTVMTPQLTFLDHEGNYCRHYQLVDQQAGTVTAAIQCRRNANWQQVAEATSYDTARQLQYQTATGREMLDTVLDALMRTAPLSQTTEDNLLRSEWQTDTTQEK